MRVLIGQVLADQYPHYESLAAKVLTKSRHIMALR
jgi:hypothetical protein